MTSSIRIPQVFPALVGKKTRAKGSLMGEMKTLRSVNILVSQIIIYIFFIMHLNCSHMNIIRRMLCNGYTNTKYLFL